MYLAEKAGQFYPSEWNKRSEVHQWLFFGNTGVGPMQVLPIPAVLPYYLIACHSGPHSMESRSCTGAGAASSRRVEQAGTLGPNTHADNSQQPGTNCRARERMQYQILVHTCAFMCCPDKKKNKTVEAHAKPLRATRCSRDAHTQTCLLYTSPSPRD